MNATTPRAHESSLRALQEIRAHQDTRVTSPQRTPPSPWPRRRCTFRIFSLTPATRTLVLRGTLVLVSRILSVGTLRATGHGQPPSFSRAPQLPSPPGLSGFSFEHNKDEGPINLGEVRQVLKHQLDLFLSVTTNNCTSTTNGTNVFTEIRVFQVKSCL